MIAQGAFGKVYKVQSKVTGLLRAMKVINNTILKDKEAKEQFFSEFSILKEMDHPNIVRIYELYMDSDRFYIISELCEGGTLLKTLKGTNTITEFQLMKIVRQILSALNYCHTKGIIHRDIKPDNIVFDNSSLESQLKLIDFGISAKLEEGDKLRFPGGTIIFTAPEVFLGEYDKKCDVWSTGVLIYLILTGEPPFYHKNKSRMVKSILRSGIDYNNEVWSLVSSECKQIVKDMLCKNPKERPNCEDLLKRSWFMNENNIPNGTFGIKLRELQETEVHAAFFHAILTFIAIHISHRNIGDDQISLFKSLDKNSDGLISRRELTDCYKTIYPSWSSRKVAEEVTNVFELLDVDQNGSIDFTEFLVASIRTSGLIKEKDLEAAFNIFDSNEDGYITKAEFMKVLEGVRLTDFEWYEFLEELSAKESTRVKKMLSNLRFQKKNILTHF